LLFGEGRKWNLKRLKLCTVYVGLPDLLADNIGNPRATENGVNKVTNPNPTLFEPAKAMSPYSRGQ